MENELLKPKGDYVYNVKGISTMGECIVCGYSTERVFTFPHGELFLCGYHCERELDFKLNHAVTAVSISFEDIINKEPFGEPSALPVIKTYGDKIYQFLNKNENRESITSQFFKLE